MMKRHLMMVGLKLATKRIMKMATKRIQFVFSRSGHDPHSNYQWKCRQQSRTEVACGQQRRLRGENIGNMRR